jgi:hypothetical protein
MTTPVHDSFPRFFVSELFPKIRAWLHKTAPEYKTFSIISPKVKLCDVGVTHKAPDAGIKVALVGQGTRFPQMAVEVGYPQTEEGLLEAARAWLHGSSGHVQSVLIVKFEAPQHPERWEDWTGWLQVFVRSTRGPYVFSCSILSR